MYQLVERAHALDQRWYMAAFWLIWCTATTLMLMPADRLPQINIWDKLEHAGTFFTLMVLAWLSYRQALFRLAMLLIAYGVLIECIQAFIPSRSFSLLDVVADSLGVLPAYWLMLRAESKGI